MPDININDVRNAIDTGYTDFASNNGIGLPAVENQIRSNQTQANDLTGQEYNTRNQNLAAANQNIGGMLSGASGGINTRTQAAIANIRQSIANAFGALGRTPQNIGAGAPDLTALAPALSQLGNQTNSSLQMQGNSLGRNIGLAEKQQAHTQSSSQSQLDTWRKLEDLSNQIKYAQQGQAVQRERFGSDLERHRILANLYMAQGGFNTFNPYSGASSGAGYMAQPYAAQAGAYGTTVH